MTQIAIKIVFHTFCGSNVWLKTICIVKIVFAYTRASTSLNLCSEKLKIYLLNVWPHLKHNVRFVWLMLLVGIVYAEHEHTFELKGVLFILL